MSERDHCQEGSLIRLVRAAAAEVKPYFDIGTREIDRSIVIMSLLDAESGSPSALKDALRSDPLLSTALTGWLSSLDSGGVLQDHVLPSALIRAELEGNDLVATLSELRLLAATGESALLATFALVGVSCREPMAIAPTMKIVPWANLPLGERKRFERDPNAMGSEFMMHRINEPTAALEIEIASRRVLFGSALEAYGSTSASATVSDEYKDIYSRASDAVRCLQLVAGKPVAIVASWHRFTNSSARMLAPTSYSYSGDIFDFSLLGPSLSPFEVEEFELSSILAAFGGHQAPHREVIRLAVDRLALSMRRRSLVDMAIDLGIALEAIILHDLGDQGELKYRIAIRGAAYLGGDPAHRRANFDLLRKAYDFRSKAVHNGSLGSQSIQASASETIGQATDLARQLAIKVLKAGTFPAWENYVLGESFD